MLDYSDGCYAHDLSSHAVEQVDLGALDPEAASELLRRGLLHPA